MQKIVRMSKCDVTVTVASQTPVLSESVTPVPVGPNSTWTPEVDQDHSYWD